jgi:hypothetical protein
MSSGITRENRTHYCSDWRLRSTVKALRREIGSDCAVC